LLSIVYHALGYPIAKGSENNVYPKYSLAEAEPLTFDQPNYIVQKFVRGA